MAYLGPDLANSGVPRVVMVAAQEKGEGHGPSFALIRDTISLAPWNAKRGVLSHSPYVVFSTS